MVVRDWAGSRHFISLFFVAGTRLYVNRNVLDCVDPRCWVVILSRWEKFLWRSDNGRNF